MTATVVTTSAALSKKKKITILIILPCSQIKPLEPVHIGPPLNVSLFLFTALRPEPVHIGPPLDSILNCFIKKKTTTTKK